MAPRTRGAAQVVKAGGEMMMWESLREAVDEEMERDPTVCIMGEPATPGLHACDAQLRWGGAAGGTRHHH